MAKQEPIENIDPVYKYIDTNFNMLKAEILKTQRTLAKLQVRITHNESLRHAVIKKSFPQFVAETARAFSQINTSENPLLIGDKFSEKRWEDLEKLGIKSIRVE